MEFSFIKAGVSARPYNIKRVLVLDSFLPDLKQ